MVRRTLGFVYCFGCPQNIKRIDRKRIHWHYIPVATAKNNAEKRGERQESKDHSPNIASLVVKQPPKLQSLLVLLSDLEKISEVVREESSQDLGVGVSSGGTATSGRGTGATGVSLRDQSIRSLPSTEAMRVRLTRHMQREVKQLEKRARRLARSTEKGSAYLLNELYAKIRKIQALIGELVEATAEVVKRLYIRLFIDHQQLV